MHPHLPQSSHGLFTVSKRRRSTPIPERDVRIPLRLEISDDNVIISQPEKPTLRQRLKTQSSILTMSVIIFSVVLATGVVLISVVIRSNRQATRTDVSRLAVDTGAFFADELDKATFPLFSLAQFATELDIFSDLPSKIGQGGRIDSLPFVSSTDGRTRRNVTGVCDRPELIKKFNDIAQTIKSNAKLGDILHTMHFAPFGVICLVYPLIYENRVRGHIPNISAAIGIDLLNDPMQQYLARSTLKSDDISIAGPQTSPICPECGLFFIVRIPVISTTDVIEIDGTTYARWGFATALIQWETLVQRSMIYEKFKSQGKEFKLTRTDRIFNSTTHMYDEKIVILAQSENYGEHGLEIVHKLQTTNNEWEIAIRYDDLSNWRSWAIAISVFVALCISSLSYIVLVQKQNHAIMKGETMVQEAKVDIERNMTAYFAHELRNPLCAIDSALSSMPNNLPDETTDLIRSMQLCSTFMSSIMNNLLDVRKMEEGKLVMRCEPFSLSKLVSNVHTMALPTIKQNVSLLVETKTDGRDWVLGDIHRLEQICYNLVSNSIKYTKNGSVTIYAGWEDDKVRLECRDTGPGIPKEEQDNMFERFIQRGGAPGSGLGLSIAKNLVNLMEGTIYFDSDPTQRPGTVCIVKLPLHSCDAPIETDDPTIEILPIDEPLRILIVDDVKMNRSMLRRRFEKCISPNCTIKEVTTGEESLSICEQGEIFDVIVMDQYMHDAGGVMVGTDAIIALRRMNVKSFIIGCSGNDLDERFFTAGADLIWKKPMPSNSEIIAQLRSAITKRSVEREQP